MIPEKNIFYDVITGRNLMEKFQMDVLYLEDVVVRDDVQMPMQKIQNGNLTDLNLMDQDNPEAIKEQYKQIRIIIDANYKKADLEQEVNKLIHLTKFQRVILCSCLN